MGFVLSVWVGGGWLLVGYTPSRTSCAGCAVCAGQASPAAVRAGNAGLRDPATSLVPRRPRGGPGQGAGAGRGRALFHPTRFQAAIRPARCGALRRRDDWCHFVTSSLRQACATWRALLPSLAMPAVPCPSCRLRPWRGGIATVELL